jgi:MFS family permease
MKLITKKDIDKPIGGLFMMIINTTIWGFISEYYLEDKDLRIVGIILGAIVLSFLYFYFKFVNAQKNLFENVSEKSAEEKSKEKWFLIIMGIEGLGIFVVKNILVNINQNEFFIPFFALIVGLHFFPLAKIFERKFDFYTGTWTCLISVLGFFLIQQKITTENIGNSIVSLGCAFSTISYGIRMINEGQKILNFKK